MNEGNAWKLKLVRAGRLRGVSRNELSHGSSLPFYSGSQTDPMQERIPAEYLGRVSGLYSAIMSWAIPVILHTV